MRSWLLFLLLPLALDASAKDVLTQRTVSMELARDLAQRRWRPAAPMAGRSARWW